MQLKKRQCALVVCVFLAVFSQVVAENKQELPTREKMRKVLIGPVMGFGVAATAAYCANKVGWGSSPLPMLGCGVVYHALHKVIARKGEQYNKWQIIPALICGYGCGYYMSSPSSNPSTGPYRPYSLVMREGIVDLSQDSNLRSVTLKSVVNGPNLYSICARNCNLGRC